MSRYSVQPTDRIFVKDYGFLSFAEDMGKNIGKNKARKRAIQKTAEAAGGLMINKVADGIPKKSPQNTSETVESETEMLKKRYVYPEERQQIIDELRLI